MDRENNEPYLERYYVFLKDRTWFPFNIFVHKFLKSDPDDCHDHPWPFCTVILKGGYWEYRPTSTVPQWKGAGEIRFGHSTDYHRIELEPGITPWTLFIPGPRIRDWGFLVGRRWVPHEQYFESRKTK